MRMGELMGDLPEDNNAGRFFVRLPKPELPLAIEPAREPLENSSGRGSDACSSAFIVLCFKDGEGLKQQSLLLNFMKALSIGTEDGKKIVIALKDFNRCEK